MHFLAVPVDSTLRASLWVQSPRKLLTFPLLLFPFPFNIIQIDFFTDSTSVLASNAYRMYCQMRNLIDVVHGLISSLSSITIHSVGKEIWSRPQQVNYFLFVFTDYLLVLVNGSIQTLVVIFSPDAVPSRRTWY